MRLRLSPDRALIGSALLLPMGLGLQYLLNIVAARSLGPEPFGLFAVAQSASSILAIVATLGFSSSMMRLVAQHRARADDAGLVSMFVFTISVVMGFACLIALLVAGVATLVGVPGPGLGLLWAALLTLPAAVDAWRESTARGLNQIVRAILPRYVLLPSAAMAALLIFDISNVTLFLVIYLAVFVALEVVFTIRLRTDLPFVRGPWPSRHTWGSWLAVSLPMSAADITRIAIERWDLIVVGILLDTSSAGVYAVASRTALLTSLPLRVINLYLGPRLAQAYHASDLASFRVLVKGGTVAAILVGLPLVILTFGFPHLLVSLFGQGFDAASPLLRVLAIGQVINLATGPVALALIMSNRERSYMRLTLLAGGIGFLLVPTLTAAFGLIGAAVATTVVVSVHNLGAGQLAWRAFRVGETR